MHNTTNTYCSIRWSCEEFRSGFAGYPHGFENWLRVGSWQGDLSNWPSSSPEICRSQKKTKSMFLNTDVTYHPSSRLGHCSNLLPADCSPWDCIHRTPGGWGSEAPERLLWGFLGKKSFWYCIICEQFLTNLENIRWLGCVLSKSLKLEIAVCNGYPSNNSILKLPNA